MVTISPEIPMLFPLCLPWFTLDSPVFYHLPKTDRYIDYSKLPLGVNMCVCMVPGDGLAYHPGCISKSFPLAQVPNPPLVNMNEWMNIYMHLLMPQSFALPYIVGKKIHIVSTFLTSNVHIGTIWSVLFIVCWLISYICVFCT